MEILKCIIIYFTLSMSAYCMDVYRVINPAPPPVNQQQEQQHSNNYGNFQQQSGQHYQNIQNQQPQNGNNQNQQRGDFSNNKNQQQVVKPQVELGTNYKHHQQSNSQRISNNYDGQAQVPANTATVKNQIVPPPGGNVQQAIVEDKYVQLQQGADGRYIPQSQGVNSNSQQPAQLSTMNDDDKPSINIYIQRAAPAEKFLQPQQPNNKNFNIQQPVNEQFIQPHSSTNEKYVPHQPNMNNKYAQEQSQPGNNNYVAEQHQPRNNNYVAEQPQSGNKNYIAEQPQLGNINNIAEQPLSANNNYPQEQPQHINNNFVHEQPPLNNNYVQEQQPSPVNNNYVQEQHRPIIDGFGNNDKIKPLVKDNFLPQKDQPLLKDNFVQRTHQSVEGDQFVPQKPVVSNNFGYNKPLQPLVSRNAEVQNPLPPPLSNNNYADPINKPYVDQIQNQNIHENNFLEQQNEVLPVENNYGFEDRLNSYTQKQTDENQPSSDRTEDNYVHEESNLPTPKPIHAPMPHPNRPIDMYHTPTESLACDNPLDDGSPYYEDDMDCNCYYVCSKQRNAIKMCCPSGLWWDQRDKKCLFGREFPLRKQALCLQLARRKALAQARSRAKEILMEADKSGEDKDGVQNDAKNSKKSDIDLTIDRYYSHLPQEYIYGHCSVQPNPAFNELKDFIWGSVDLRQSLKGGPTEIRINVTGLNTNDNNRLHGFHVHEYGDLSRGCESAGGHYDPFGVVHGGPRDSPQFRHFGDLGNVEEDSHGNIEEDIKDYLVSLLGPFSVLGRAIVIHEGEDDLGRGNSEDSLLTGSAGARLACCTIGLSDGSRWP